MQRILLIVHDQSILVENFLLAVGQQRKRNSSVERFDRLGERLGSVCTNAKNRDPLFFKLFEPWSELLELHRAVKTSAAKIEDHQCSSPFGLVKRKHVAIFIRQAKIRRHGIQAQFKSVRRRR